MLVLVRIATAIAVPLWIVVGGVVGIDYGLADESTARAQAPVPAVYASCLVPLAGGALFCRAALLAGGDDRIAVRRSVAGRRDVPGRVAGRARRADRQHLSSDSRWADRPLHLLPAQARA